MANRETLQAQLHTVFDKIRQQETFESPLASDLVERFDKAVLSAAISKCVEINLLMNGQSVGEENAFLFLSNLRGTCEDLIVLQYVARMPAAKRRRFLTLSHRLRLHQAMLTQIRFFRLNNPFQPVAGGDAENLEDLVKKDRGALRRFWQSQKESKKDGPSVRDMADRANLSQTYEYIYFLSSNFAHFNPPTLIRTGWGPEAGPFKFSVHNFSTYYADLASFYGAVLFIGFYYRLGKNYFSSDAAANVETILEIIDAAPRWPELVTFEELNLKPPMLPFMAWAMRKSLEGSDEQVPYGAILREVRGLDRNVGASR